MDKYPEKEEIVLHREKLFKLTQEGLRVEYEKIMRTMPLRRIRLDEIMGQILDPFLAKKMFDELIEIVKHPLAEGTPFAESEKVSWHKILIWTFYEEKRHDNALTVLKSLLEIAPENPEYHLLMAEHYALFLHDDNLRYSHLEKAKELLNALNMTPSDLQSKLGEFSTALGISFLLKGDVQIAAQYFRIGESLNPSPVRVRSGLLCYFVSTCHGDIFIHWLMDLVKQCTEHSEPFLHYAIGHNLLVRGLDKDAANEYALVEKKSADLANRFWKEKQFTMENIFRNLAIYGCASRLYAQGLTECAEGKGEKAEIRFLEFENAVVKEQLKDMEKDCIINQIFKIDTKMRTLYIANSFSELSERIWNLVLEIVQMYNTMTHTKYLVLDLDTVWYDSHAARVEFLMYLKLRVLLLILYSIGPERVVFYKRELGVLSPLRRMPHMKRISRELAESREALELLKFRSDAQALNSFENFIMEVKAHKTPTDIPISTQMLMIKSLCKPFLAIAGNLSIEVIKSAISEEMKLEMKLYYEKFKSFFKEGKKRQEIELEKRDIFANYICYIERFSNGKGFIVLVIPPKAKGEKEKKQYVPMESKSGKSKRPKNSLTPIQMQMLTLMAMEMAEDSEKMVLSPIEWGWVSYRDFKENVKEWSPETTGNGRIRDEISKIRSFIRSPFDKFKVIETDDGKGYRFGIRPDRIHIK